MTTTIEYFHLAENAIIDQRGLVSLINIFNGIETTEFPAVPSKFAVAFAIRPGDKDAVDGMINFEVRLVKDGKEEELLIDAKGSGKVEKNKHGKNKSIVTASDFSGNVTLPEAGNYTLQLLVNGHLKSTISVFVEPKEVKNS